MTDAATRVIPFLTFFFENYHFLNFIVSFSYNVHKSAKFVDLLNPLNSKGSYSATSNNMVIGTLAVDG